MASLQPGIRPSSVQAWLRGRQDILAPTYVRVLLANLSAIFGAALEDGLIPKQPVLRQGRQGSPY